MTSRMLVWSVSSAAQRSTPSAMPPCGGAPYSNASRMPPNFASCCSGEWPWSANERASSSRVWKRIEPPPSSQPLSARSYWSARARPAGSSGSARERVARRRRQQRLSPRASTPLNGLWVASQRRCSSSHWYIGNWWTQTYASTCGSARPRRSASSTRSAPEHLLGVDVRVGHDEHEVARRAARRPRAMAGEPLLAHDLDDRAADARRPRAPARRGPRRRPLRASSVSSSSCSPAHAGHARRREPDDAAARRRAPSSNTRKPEPATALAQVARAPSP